jgi:hypothetical protein
MEPPGINQEVITHLEHPSIEPQTRGSFDKLRHVEGLSDTTLPESVGAEDDLTRADVSYDSAKATSARFLASFTDMPAQSQPSASEPSTPYIREKQIPLYIP